MRYICVQFEDEARAMVEDYVKVLVNHRIETPDGVNVEAMGTWLPGLHKGL